MQDSINIIDRLAAESVQVKTRFFAENGERIALAAERMVKVFQAGRKVLLFGNGGSASDAQHISAEFVGRFIPDRPPLPAIALTTDTSILTACSNDYGYAMVFARQVIALGRPGDAAIGISTSGDSPNVLEALAAARAQGLFTIGFTGETGGKMRDRVDILFRVPSKTTPRIQETHITLGHILCELIDRELFPDAYPPSLIVESRYSIKPLAFDGITTYPLADRKSKVNAGMFGKPLDGSDTILSFISKLPHILAGESLRTLIRAILYARSSNKPIIWGLGGHVIKVGLGAVLNDLMEAGFVTGIAMNGSAAIHDFEVALRGATSEEVEEVIGSGQFGMARETAEYMNGAINRGAANGVGIGEALGGFIEDAAAYKIDVPYPHLSILAQAYRRRTPVTVHVAIGTDTIHAHPHTVGESLGKASYHDFRLFCSMAKELDGGGVYINVGSAVILPEVFLKAISVIRNLGATLEEFTTANLDFIQHYRPTQNVLKRPTQNSGQSVALTGHHEIMIPLIAAALKASVQVHP